MAGDGTWLNPARRARDLAAAAGEQADLVVIGGGVTGAGCALDAVARGLKVVLVEAGDLAIGTSSRSGKTFHGGLRYLEQLNFRLVAHAIEERDLMVRTLCPHMARPESFLYPLTHAFWERPYVTAGVALYDLFGLKGRAVPLQRQYGRAALKRHMPSVDTKRVVGGILYYDALMDDARHTLAVARTAAGLGARVLTRCALADFTRDGGRISGVVVRDGDDGTQHMIAARAVINAAGIWADEIQQKAGANTFRVQPAKGVHLLLRADAIDSDTGILARATDSVIIARRWYGYWLVGTTDTPWTGDKSAPVPEPADIDYLLDNLNTYLERKVTRADVLGTYAGLRPLLRPVGGVDATSALSRDHAVLDGPPGLTTIVGGKYTTYRRMARDAVDAALAPLGVTAPSTTNALPLLGSPQWPQVMKLAPELARRFGMTVPDAGRMLQRHGDRVRDLLALADADPALAAPVPGAPQYAVAELRYAAQAEGARSLTDVMARRTHLSIEQPDGGLSVARFVAQTIAPALGWTAQQTDAECAGYERYVERERRALHEAVGSSGAPRHDGRYQEDDNDRDSGTPTGDTTR